MFRSSPGSLSLPSLISKQAFYISVAMASLALSSSNASAQVTERNTRALYKEKVEQVLQQFPQARWAFGESEVVKHVVNYRAEQELAKELGRATRDFSKEEGRSSTLALKGKNISKRTDNFETETSVAISRTNPNVIVAGANDDGMPVLGMVAYVSTTGGNTWSTKRLPAVDHDEMISGGDPVIVPDEAGGFYYSFLSYDFTFQWSDIQIAHSTDGAEWEMRKPVVQRNTQASILEDKQWMAVDREHESPFFGRIYMVWRRFNFQNQSVRQLFSFSDDKAQTWSTPRALNVPFDQFAFVRVGQGGTVFISASFSEQFADEGEHGMLISTDGGASFTQNPIADFFTYEIGGSGRGMIKGELGFRAFPYMSFDVDPISNEVFLVGGTYDRTNNIADLKYYYSANGGRDWDEFSFIATSDFRGDRFMPAVAFDRDTRTAWATYFSSEHDGNNEMTKVYLAKLTSEGIARIDTIQDEEFDPTLALQTQGAEYIGDYIGSDASKGKHVAIWSQSVGEDRDAEVFGIVTSTETVQGSVTTVHSLPFELSEALVQPVISQLQFHVSGDASNASISLYDARSGKLGTHAVSLNNEQMSLDVSTIPAGFYYAVVEIDGHQAMRKFVKQ